MSSEIIFLIEESMEGGYEAKALGYSVFTEFYLIYSMEKFNE